MRIKPSLLPQEIQSSFNCFFAFSGSGTSSAAGFVFGADEKPPTHANVSRVCETEVERLSAAHRDSRQRAALAIFLHGIF
jgi:hypothetical protein